jgi:hypothetical protein
VRTGVCGVCGWGGVSEGTARGGLSAGVSRVFAAGCSAGVGRLSFRAMAGGVGAKSAAVVGIHSKIAARACGSGDFVEASGTRGRAADAAVAGVRRTGFSLARAAFAGLGEATASRGAWARGGSCGICWRRRAGAGRSGGSLRCPLNS